MYSILDWEWFQSHWWRAFEALGMAIGVGGMVTQLGCSIMWRDWFTRKFEQEKNWHSWYRNRHGYHKGKITCLLSLPLFFHSALFFLTTLPIVIHALVFLISVKYKWSWGNIMGFNERFLSLIMVFGVFLF